jgi:hypothetical protein
LKKKATSSFSERFHELCDVAGFVSGRGRATEVSRFFNVGITSARNWLVEDICPRNPTLVKIVSRLQKYNRLNESLDEKQLLLWLEKGESYIQNPFQEPQRSSEASTELLKVLKKHPGICRVLEQLERDMDCSTDENTANLIEKALSEILESREKV